MAVEFIVRGDNTEAILNELEKRTAVALEACGLVAEGHAKAICPVDTGRLRASITHGQIDDNTEAIGTNVDYAPYVELGTSRSKAQPYLKPAVVDHVSEYKAIIEQYLKS